MSSYEIIKIEFERLCDVYSIDVPNIEPAFIDDKCDTTNPPHFIRIKEQSCDSVYQARHLFGHYLSDLHAIDDEQSDIVADIIADLIGEKYE
jgi:hypothetical protein